MIWYILLSFLFSLGISLTTVEMYFSTLPVKKQVAIFCFALIVGMILWPVLLLFIDGAIVWNTYLRLKYCDEIEVKYNENEIKDESFD